MSKNLALFIDCGRLEAAFMGVIFDYLQNEHYNICVKKAYVAKDNLDAWYSQLDKHYFKINIGSSQANSSVRLSMDVAKALYSGMYDSIAIASNYREFGILASEIRSNNLEALCFYQYSKGNESFLRRAYNTIYNLEPLHIKENNELQIGEDIFDMFTSALEGLDTQTLAEKLKSDTSTKQSGTNKKKGTIKR